MFSPDEQAVLREMTEMEVERFQLEASMEEGMPPPYPIDWRGVQVSEVALGLLRRMAVISLAGRFLPTVLRPLVHAY